MNDIYNHYVATSHVTFDLEPMTVSRRETWFRDRDPRCHPILVSTQYERLIGFTSAGRFRARPGYDTTVETSVYVDPSAVGTRVGTSLYAALLDTLAGRGLHRAVAGIALPNEGSVNLHLRAGFHQVAHFTEQGWSSSATGTSHGSSARSHDLRNSARGPAVARGIRWKGTRMRALALVSFDVPAAVIDVPEPVAGPGEVLVRVSTASVNAFDVGVAAGAMKDLMPYEFPAVVGNDVAGTIEAIGDGVEGFSIDERVFGMMGMKGAIHDGSFAEFTNPQSGAIAVAPDGLSDADAGTLAVAGTTAMSAVEAVDAGEGARVLIVGATGGVGTFATQLATLRGAHVIASVRPGDEDFVTGLGAAETVDYTGDLVAAISGRYPDGIDAVIDAVNRDHDAFATLAGIVRVGGRATSVVGDAGGSLEIGGVSVSNAGGDPAHLLGLADLVVQGKVRVAARRTYPLADAAQALQDFSNEHTLGKLVIAIM